MENEEKLGQEPAFAISAHSDIDDKPGRGRANNSHFSQRGMSKRFYAACAAMHGLLSNTNIGNWVSEDKQEQRRDIVITAFSFADELLKQENLK